MALLPALRCFVPRAAKGLNVTVPFKQEAWQLCDQLSERAQLAEAVNTIKFEDGRIIGDNTDGIGLCRDICHNLQQALQGKRILLLGAGGAARGVILPLLAEHPACLTIANRTASKAEQLAQRFQHYGQLGASSYEALAGQQFDVIINATSASLSDALPPLPGGCFAPGSLAYDMMYGKGLTPFLLFAQQQGSAQLADGLGMLVEQAAEAFCIWRGVRPDTTAVIAELRAGLC
jgi:shikimate dehydrogenase